MLIVFLALILFLSAEGQNREWFSDPQIMMTLAALLVVTGGYMLYSKQVAAPLIDLNVYRYTNVAVGTLFYFIIGLLNNTGSVIMSFMSGLLGFNELYMARTHLFTGIGLLISIPICTYMLFHKVYLRITAIVGFLSFTLYHALMYFRFYPGITESDFMLPLIFKGMGIGFLYVLSSLYISENIPKHLSGSRMMSGILARNVLAIFLGAAVLSTFITKLTVQHKTGIGQQMTLLNKEAATQYKNTQIYYRAKGMSQAEADQMAYKSLQNEMASSATLLAYKDIYLVMSIISFIPILLILLFRFGNRPIQEVRVEPIPI